MSFGKGALSHRAKRQIFVRRFRLPKKMDPKKGRNIVIIEKGEGFELHEHNYELDGQWQQITCPKKSGLRPRCALCRKGYRPYWVAFFTIIDRDKWKDRNGKIHQDEKKVLPVKDQSMGRLEAILAREKAEDLFGAEIYTCRTGGQQSPAIGDIFDPVKRWTEKSLKREFAEQLEEDETFLDSFDYNEVFAPPSDEEIEDIADALPKPDRNGDKDRKKGSSFNKAGRGGDDEESEGEGRRVFRGKSRDEDESSDDDEEKKDEDESEDSDESDEKKPSKKSSKASDEDEESSDEDESEEEEAEEEEEKAPAKKGSKKSDEDESEDEKESKDEESEEEESEEEADEEEADEAEEAEEAPPKKKAKKDDDGDEKPAKKKSKIKF